MAPQDKQHIPRHHPETVDQHKGRAPLLSVVIPTHDRERCLRNLLDHLSAQDLEPSLYEVIVVDDGSPTDIRELPELTDRPYELRLIRQEQGGPAKARNTGLRHARGRWVVFYNDDALPSTDNLSRHLRGQIQSNEPVAILGSFDFTPEACKHKFLDLLQHSDLLFEYRRMIPGRLHSWKSFYTCNLSVPRDCIEKVGGFDEDTFRHALCEDIELGLRLERQLGLRVLYDPRILAWHDHDLDIASYRRRSFLLGVYFYKIWRKHGEAAALWSIGMADPEEEGLWLSVRVRAEEDHESAERIYAVLKAHERKKVSSHPEARRLARWQLGEMVSAILHHECRRGLATAAADLEKRSPSRAPQLQRAPTSVIIPNLNGFPHVVGAIESLRRTTAEPVEVIVVDNGSTDGSLEWLREQQDLQVLELGTNLGAPEARNRGLATAQGDTVLFCDNDVVFTPRWREILLAHLEAWPDIGLVGPVSNYASEEQRVGQLPRLDLDAYAEGIYRKHRGEHDYVHRLIGFFLLVRREVVERIGGNDRSYAPWGFEDDDYSVRAGIAGFNLRVARDCFIYHIGSATARTANLDYAALLHQNWKVFKRRWGLDPDLPYHTDLDWKALVDREFDPELHHVPLTAPDSTSSEHKPDIAIATTSATTGHSSEDGPGRARR